MALYFLWKRPQIACINPKSSFCLRLRLWLLSQILIFRGFPTDLVACAHLIKKCNGNLDAAFFEAIELRQNFLLEAKGLKQAAQSIGLGVRREDNSFCQLALETLMVINRLLDGGIPKTIRGKGGLTAVGIADLEQDRELKKLLITKQ